MSLRIEKETAARGPGRIRRPLYPCGGMLGVGRKQHRRSGTSVVSGLCGWIGFESGTHRQENVLTQMADTFGRGEFQHVIAARAALGGFGDVFAELHHGKTVLAVIEGRPLWRTADLRLEAEKSGHARALALGYARSGHGVLELLGGEFALAVVCPGANEALLAVDRIGLRTLAYAVADKTLVFGTTTDSVRAHPLVDSTASPQALFDYVFFGFVPSPLTVYREQRKLIPGQYVLYRDGQVNASYYWRPEFEDQLERPVSELEMGLRERLDAAVRKRVTDGVTGAFLSGGLDSSVICGLLARRLNDSVRSYSIGFDVQGYDELTYARAAAKRFGLTPHEYYVTEHDVAKTIPIVARAFDEPFGNASAVPVYLCARMAHQAGTEVLLAGDGGDELFAGNERYIKQSLFERYGMMPAFIRRGMLEPAVFGFPAGGKIALIAKARRYIQNAKIPLPERLQSYNILRNVLVESIFCSELAEEIDPRHPFNVWEDVYRRPKTESYLNRLLFLDWKHVLADCDLRKVSRMCEAAGVTARYPMLDEGVVELSMQVPMSLKLRHNTLRAFYKKTFANLLPRQIINKPKHGFGLPFGVWLKTSSELQALTLDAISSLKQRRILRSEWLDWLMDQHHREHAVFYGPPVWSLVVLEYWMRDRGL